VRQPGARFDVLGQARDANLRHARGESGEGKDLIGGEAVECGSRPYDLEQLASRPNADRFRSTTGRASAVCAQTGPARKIREERERGAGLQRARVVELSNIGRVPRGCQLPTGGICHPGAHPPVGQMRSQRYTPDSL
jgi:hypothetical protein